MTGQEGKTRERNKTGRTDEECGDECEEVDGGVEQLMCAVSLVQGHQHYHSGDQQEQRRYYHQVVQRRVHRVALRVHRSARGTRRDVVRIDSSFILVLMKEWEDERERAEHIFAPLARPSQQQRNQDKDK